MALAVPAMVNPPRDVLVPPTCLCRNAPTRAMTPLNPKAALWQPLAVFTKPKLSKEIQLTEFIQAIAGMVDGCAHEVENLIGVPVSVHTIQGQGVWSIIYRLRDQDMWCRDKVLELSQGYIQSAAKVSDVFHLLGCRRDPFRPKQKGFSALLGSMQDENVACWNLYDTGKCTKEDKCRWQHPVFRHRLVVLVKKLTIQTSDHPKADAALCQ